MSGTIATVQNMKVSRLCNSQSNTLHQTRNIKKIVTSARAPVASCLHLIGRKVACLRDILSRRVHQRLSLLRTRFAALSTSSQNGLFQRLRTTATVRHHAQGSVKVGFVDVQSGFLQLPQTQTWVKCKSSLDSAKCVVYSGIRFKAIRAASKELEQDE